MIVCLCHRVSDRDIAAAVQRGCDSYDALQDELLVASACGACGDYAREVLEQICPRAEGHCATKAAGAPPSKGGSACRTFAAPV